jgi:hypothetical protein
VVCYGCELRPLGQPHGICHLSRNKQACEPACDEAVIAEMTESQRRDYGETLLNLASSHRLPVGILTTNMGEEKARLKEKIVNIMRYKKTAASTIMLSLLLTILLCGCGPLIGNVENPDNSDNSDVSVPSGESVSDDQELTPLTQDEISWFNDEFFNGEYMQYTMDSGFRDMNGDIYLYYMDSSSSTNRELLLKKNGDGYLFYSNIELTSASTETK